MAESEKLVTIAKQITIKLSTFAIIIASSFALGFIIRWII